MKQFCYVTDFLLEKHDFVIVWYFKVKLIN